jgi:hypothetical protein
MNSQEASTKVRGLEGMITRETPKIISIVRKESKAIQAASSIVLTVNALESVKETEIDLVVKTVQQIGSLENANAVVDILVSLRDIDKKQHENILHSARTIVQTENGTVRQKKELSEIQEIHQKMEAVEKKRWFGGK